MLKDIDSISNLVVANMVNKLVVSNSKQLSKHKRELKEVRDKYFNEVAKSLRNIIMNIP